MRRKIIGILVCMLLIGTVIPVTGTININIAKESNPQVLRVDNEGDGDYITIQEAIDAADDGTLSGYVNNTSGNPIEGALVRVHFHQTYEEDYSDSAGYYHVTNIPICKCLKFVSCSKENYKTKWVLLGIAENTTRGFILLKFGHIVDRNRAINGFFLRFLEHIPILQKILLLQR
jgi:hypothetical protein